MRTVPRYLSSDPQSSENLLLHVGEDLPSNSKPSKLSNIKHTKGKYKHKCKLDCSCCSWPCICYPIASFLLIILALSTSAGIIGGGIYLFADHGTNENIRGSCTITDVNSYTKKDTCSDGTSNYDCHYYVTKIKYTVNEDNNPTIFPCKIGTRFQEEYKKKLNRKEGTKWACYTNPECEYISFSKNYTPKDPLYGLWLVLWMLLTIFSVCYCAPIACYCREELRDIIGKCWNARDDWRKGCCCLCIEYKGYKQGKNEHNKYQWDKVMNEDDRFDYVMSNWMNKYGESRNKAIDNKLINGIPVDIESIIYRYLY